MNKDETIIEPGYSCDVGRFGELFGGGDVRRVDDSGNDIDDERHRPHCGLGDEKMIAQGCGARRQPEAGPDIQDGNDTPFDVNDSDHDVGCPGERSHFDHRQHAFHRREAEGEALLVEMEDYEQRGGVFLHDGDGLMVRSKRRHRRSRIFERRVLK